MIAAGQFLVTLADVWDAATQRERRELLTALLDVMLVDVAAAWSVCNRKLIS